MMKIKKYRDDKLQVRKQSKSSYQGRIYLKWDKEKKRGVYTYNSIKSDNEKDALKVLNDWFDDIQYQIRHNIVIKTKKDNSFTQMSEYYINNFNWKNSATHKDDGKYNEHIKKWIEDQKITEVNTSSLKSLRDDYLPNITESKNTIAHWFNYIRKVYRFHLENNLITKDEVPDFPKLSKNASKRIFLDKGQYRKLINKSIDRMNEPSLNRKTQLVRKALNRFIIFQVATGMRSKETYNLTWDQITEKVNRYRERYLEIEVLKTKTKIDRTVISKPPAVYALKELKEVYLQYQDQFTKLNLDKSKVFPFKFSGSNNQLLKSADLYEDKKLGKKRDIYVYRHTYISWAVLGGEPVVSLAEQVGNSVPMIQKHYTNFLNATHFADTLSSLKIIK